MLVITIISKVWYCKNNKAKVIIKKRINKLIRLYVKILYNPMDIWFCAKIICNPVIL